LHIDIRGETFEEKPSKINLQTHFFLKGKSYSGKSKELRMSRVNAILQVAAEGFAEEPDRERDGPVNGRRWGCTRLSFSNGVSVKHVKASARYAPFLSDLR
jgi:hypothetical protein